MIEETKILMTLSGPKINICSNDLLLYKYIVARKLQRTPRNDVQLGIDLKMSRTEPEPHQDQNKLNKGSIIVT
jgi:hypothetical protein